MDLLTKITKKLFADEHGKIVLMQKPNAPLVIWALSAFVNWLVAAKTPSMALHLVGTTALVVWALLEVGFGVNYFRRALGTVVLLWIISGLFW